MGPLALAALIGGGAGLIKGIENQKRQSEYDKYRKAAIAHSPWTGMGDPGSVNLPGPLSSALQGAAMGASVGSLFPGAAAGGSTVAGMSSGIGAGQQALSPEMMKWQMLNQMMGGPGYTMEG